MTGGLGEPYAIQGLLAFLIPDGSLVSFEGAIAMLCLSVLPES